MDNTNVILLTDCSETDCIYGFILIQDVAPDEMQSKINEIKNDAEFIKEYGDDWCIEDILTRLPSEWYWEYVRYTSGNVVTI